jgi:FkbM family methyltransferase
MKLAYDVGAHDGADTAHYLSLGYRVVGIEARPDLCAKLRRRFERQIADGRCTVLEVAVGEAEGTMPFFLSENDQWNSFDRAAAARSGYKATEITVQTRPLSSVIKEYGTPELVKIDIEGADEMALRGMGDIWPRYLSFEAWSNCDDMLLELIDRGYTKLSLVQQKPLRPIVIPTAGTLSHIQWSARQWLRWQLRQRPWIHRALAGTRSSLRFAAGRRAHKQNPSAAPLLQHTMTPMEHADGWHKPADFLWLWRNVIASGMIDSSWFDVHASK